MRSYQAQCPAGMPPEEVPDLVQEVYAAMAGAVEKSEFRKPKSIHSYLHNISKLEKSHEKKC